RAALDAAGIGTKIGKVTAKLGRLPIVNDFHAQLADLDLGEVLGKEKKLAVRLDKRDPLAARRSAFLHRLVFLAIPFAALGSAGGAIDSAPAFPSLAEALRHLAVLDRYASFRGLRREAVEGLLTRCYDRACFALPGSAAVPEEEQKEVVDGLVSVADILQRAE